MAFDVQGALSAGYSQEEINNYLRSKQTLSKAENIPVLGGIIKPISKVIRGSVAGSELNKNLDTVSSSSQAQQKLSIQYAKQAQKEADPVKRKMLLDKSKSISQGATQQLEGYVNPNLQVMPEDYAAGKGNYAIDALKAGLAAGEAYSLPSQIIGAKNLIKSVPQKIKSIPTFKQTLINTAKKVENLKSKTDVNKKIWDSTVNLAGKNKTKVSNSNIIDKLINKANKDYGGSGVEFDAVMKKILKENPSKKYSIKQLLDIGAKVPYSASTKSSTLWLRSAKKDIIKSILENKAPEVAEMKKIYQLSKSVEKPLGSWFKKFIGASALGAGGVAGYNILKK